MLLWGSEWKGGNRERLDKKEYEFLVVHDAVLFVGVSVYLASEPLFIVRGLYSKLRLILEYKSHA